ncbi:unnamed protein product [Bursaphelenchus xylophilus]|uniref:(pine wood nematode) hypothetical protein n=1 Tax=Bursaphelenchus xylophilus TaxID=6326 RepID=A0A7I8WQH7_BURXY|nr:unnamed protein product [Bursaphelenchus xylophilus]CAG9096850.1 unnamed protein product [Bursaphelenchus xylophilus]
MDECRRLAQEGEEEIKRGNTQEGIQLLQNALAHGTQDTLLLSAIYSQLGNGYYAIRDFDSACKYHANDLLLSHVHNDPVMEIKTLCNMAHSLAMNGKVDEAIENAKTVIETSENIPDMAVYECRGYYALGFSCFQKFLIDSARLGFNDEGVINTIKGAIDAYEQCLKKSADGNGKILSGCSVVRSLTLGNLGISYYHLGQFTKAKQFYEMRLETAKSVGDRSAQLRTYTNLGNTCVQLGEYEGAVIYYSRALTIANRDKKRDHAAQLYFNLGSTAALQGSFKEAFSYHLSHLELAKALRDVAGECRAYLNLANCLENLDQLKKSLYFLAFYWNLAYKLNEQPLIEKARDAAEQMVQRHPQELVDKDDFVQVEDCSDLFAVKDAMEGSSKSSHCFKLSNLSESLESFIVDCSKKRRNSTPKRSRIYEVGEPSNPELADCGIQRNPVVVRSTKSSPADDNDEAFFDRISRFQSKQYDDQRCDIDILKDRTNEGRQGDTMNKMDTLETSARKSFSGKFKTIARKFKNSNSKISKSFSRPNNFKKSGSLSRDADTNSLFGTASVGPRCDDRSSRHSAIDFTSVGSGDLSLEYHANEDPTIPLGSTGKMESVSERTTESLQENVFGNEDSALEDRFRFLRKNPEDILDLIMNMQGRRMDEQRADPILPGLSGRDEYLKSLSEQNDGAMSERLYEIIMERQSHRLDDQRSELGGRPKSCSDLPELPHDMSELVITMSSRRLEDQRASLNPLKLSDSNLNSTGDNPPVRCASASATIN